MKLAPRSSRLLALALLAAALALLYVLAVQPLLNLYVAREHEILFLSARASRLSTSDESAPELRRTLAGLQRRAGGASPFWPGSTDAVAAADLQARVKSVLDSQGANIESAETLPPRLDHGLHEIALKIRFTGQIDQLERVVQSIETMTPSLVVEHLSVQAADTATDAHAPLSIELQALGLAEPTEEGGPAS